MNPCHRSVAVVANRVITPIAVIGSRVDLAVNDPVELPGKRGLLCDDVHAAGSDAEDDPQAATSLARLNVTLKPTKDAFPGRQPLVAGATPDLKH